MAKSKTKPRSPAPPASLARVTQILNLSNLAPDIQQEIVDLEPTTDYVPRFREREVRTLAIMPNYEKQRLLWKRLVRRNQHRNIK